MTDFRHILCLKLLPFYYCLKLLITSKPIFPTGIQEKKSHPRRQRWRDPGQGERMDCICSFKCSNNLSQQLTSGRIEQRWATLVMTGAHKHLAGIAAVQVQGGRTEALSRQDDALRSSTESLSVQHTAEMSSKEGVSLLPATHRKVYTPTHFRSCELASSSPWV